MSNTIGIGFIGAGGNTRLRHLPGFAAIDKVRLVTVANRSDSSSQAVADAFGIHHIARNWRDVITDPEVDAVCIGTWPYLHAEASIAALEAGKHVLTEARMAATLKEAERMLAASRAHSDLVAQIVPSPFTLDLDATIMRLLGDGILGDIRAIFVNHANAANLDPESLLNWRQDPEYSGINMLTMGIFHEVIQRWFPDARFSVDAATGRTFIPERIHWDTGVSQPVQIPDSLHILGSMDGTAVLGYYFSSVEPGPGCNAIRMIGSEASLRVDLGNQALLLARKGQEEHSITVPEATKRGWRVEEDFIDSIRSGTPVRLTAFADGLRYMAFTDAVYNLLR